MSLDKTSGAQDNLNLNVWGRILCFTMDELYGYCKVTHLLVKLEHDDSDEELQLQEGILLVHSQHISGLQKHDLSL